MATHLRGITELFDLVRIGSRDWRRSASGGLGLLQLSAGLGSDEFESGLGNV